MNTRQTILKDFKDQSGTACTRAYNLKMKKKKKQKKKEKKLELVCVVSEKENVGLKSNGNNVHINQYVYKPI